MIYAWSLKDNRGLSFKFLFAMLVAAALNPVRFAWADASRFKTTKVDVLPAAEIFSSVASVQVDLGKELTLPLKKSAAARAALAKGFQLRVLRMVGAGDLPVELAEFYPCVVYIGSVHKFKSSASMEEIDLGRLEQLSWLELVRDNPAKPGRFLIVVEPLGDDAQLIRVERGMAQDQYFKGAIRLEVAPPTGISQASINKAVDDGAVTWALAMTAAKVNDPSQDCMGKRAESVVTGDETKVACLTGPGDGNLDGL
jgi:hypothetical protein